MKKKIKLKGLKHLSRNEQKNIAGGGTIPREPANDDGCGWNMCKSKAGFCTKDWNLCE